MLTKRLKAQRRARKTRAKIRQIGITRLCVHRTLRHLYAQVITSSPMGDRVVVSASTLDREVKEAGGLSLTVQSAGIVGNVIAKRAISAGISRVAFDRSGFKYHGRIKALAESARSGGLQF